MQSKTGFDIFGAHHSGAHQGNFENFEPWSKMLSNTNSNFVLAR